MATTTNFGWTTPNDTDLVKDGAAAIRTLGSSIDTSFVDLKGGTTGQVLAKASGTDLDFTWATDASGIPATIFDAKGDIIAASAADTAARLAVGANGTVLTADSTTATGLKWAAAASGATAFTLLNAGGTSLTGATNITVSGITSKEIVVLIQGASSANAYTEVSVRPNNSTSGIYNIFGVYNAVGSTYSAGNFDARGGYQSSDGIILFQTGNNAGGTGSGYCYIDKTNETGFKTFNSAGSGRGTGGATADWQQLILGGILEFTAAITSITVNSSTGNFDAGTLYVYGAS